MVSYFNNHTETEEIWKDVVGYEGYYQVSNLGQVRNATSGKILSQYIANNGYLSLRLGKCGKSKKMLKLVHRLVAEAFIPNPSNLPCVGHKDETHTNNRADNLAWCNHCFIAKEFRKVEKNLNAKRNIIEQKLSATMRFTIALLVLAMPTT